MVQVHRVPGSESKALRINMIYMDDTTALVSFVPGKALGSFLAFETCVLRALHNSANTHPLCLQIMNRCVLNLISLQNKQTNHYLMTAADILKKITVVVGWLYVLLSVFVSPPFSLPASWHMLFFFNVVNINRPYRQGAQDVHLDSNTHALSLIFLFFLFFFFFFL